MKPVDDELFAQIKERLTEHEEVYLPGAWERFEKKERNKTGWIWLAGLSSAAAVLLIGFTLFFTRDQVPQNNELQQQVKNGPSKQNTDTVTDIVPEGPGSLTAIENLKTKISENKNIVEQRKRNNIPNNPIVVKLKQSVPIDYATISPAAINPATIPVPVTQPMISDVKGVVLKPGAVDFPVKKDVQGVTDISGVIAKAIVKEVVKEKDSVKVNSPRSFQEFLDAEVKSNSAMAALKSSAKKADKWEMGLMVAPSVGNAKKLNMGYGLSMDYALSDKVSLNSGISYNEMGATKSMEQIGGAPNSPAPAAALMATETKSLKSVDANLVGIDIPLGIKYYLSKKFYTNIGVSAFAVLNQKQNNNYVQGSVEHAVSADQENNPGFKAFFQERTISEVVPSGEIRGDKYLGFYNISFGFKQQISGSKAFSVEPFMKLPMKEFTNENLYLIGTGVRIKFDF